MALTSRTVHSRFSWYIICQRPFVHQYIAFATRRIHKQEKLATENEQTFSTSMREGSVVKRKRRSIIPSPLMADVGTMLMKVRTSCQLKCQLMVWCGLQHCAFETNTHVSPAYFTNLVLIEYAGIEALLSELRDSEVVALLELVLYPHAHVSTEAVSLARLQLCMSKDQPSSNNWSGAFARNLFADSMANAALSVGSAVTLTFWACA